MSEVYSINGQDDWTEDFSEIMEIIKGDGLGIIYIGNSITPSIERYISGIDDLIEVTLSEMALEECWEWQSSPFSLGEQCSDKFNQYIKEAVVEFYRSNQIEAGFTLVENIRKLDIKEGVIYGTT